MIFNTDSIETMDKRYRAHFINGLSGYKSANLLGTCDGKQRTNLCVVSSFIHLGAHPPIMAYINRPHSVSRHSLENIIETGFFSCNHIDSSMLQAAHQTSARYPREQSEFDATGLTPQWLENFPAPFVQESEIKIGLSYIEHITLPNGTLMIIGAIEKVVIPESLIDEDGSIKLTQSDTLALSGLDAYSKVNDVTRLPYAKA